MNSCIRTYPSLPSICSVSVFHLGPIFAVAVSVLGTVLGLLCTVTVCVSEVLEQPTCRKLSWWLAIEAKTGGGGAQGFAQVWRA